MDFKGYVRENGDVGVRNHVVVISSVACANFAVKKISERVAGAIPVTHNEGTCGELGEDVEQTVRTLVGVAENANVAGALFVGLGCERVNAHMLADIAAKSGKRVCSLLIQESGEKRTIKKGRRIVKELAKSASKEGRGSFPLSKLIVGTKCGASDFSSGIASNPAVGHAVDLLIKEGGCAVLAETLEILGAEDHLAERAVSREAAQEIIRIVREAEKRAIGMGGDLLGSQPSAGNIQAGISTIEEKSLGAVKKGGSSKVMGVLKYSEKGPRKGLFIMDTPGFDVQCVTGLIAGGAHVILFTTGLGTPIGSAISPVIKITANYNTYRKMKDTIDMDVSSMIKGEESIEEAGKRIFEELIKVASGKLTKAEKAGHIEFSINRIGFTV